jgi:hypothetical protein
MYERVRQVPKDKFVEVWNTAVSMVEVVERIKELAAGQVARWAVMSRAASLRKEGVELKPFPTKNPAEA